MAVTFADLFAAIDPVHAAAGIDQAIVGPQPHGTAHVAALLAALDPAFAFPFGHQADHRLGTGPELGRAGTFDASQIAGRLDHRHLHAEADAEIGNTAFASQLHRRDLTLGTAFAEAAGHQDAVDAFEIMERAFFLEGFRLDPLDADAHIVGDATVAQRLVERFVGVLEAGVLAHHGDLDLAFGGFDAGLDVVPNR